MSNSTLSGSATHEVTAQINALIMSGTGSSLAGLFGQDGARNIVQLGQTVTPPTEGTVHTTMPEPADEPPVPSAQQLSTQAALAEWHGDNEQAEELRQRVATADEAHAPRLTVVGGKGDKGGKPAQNTLAIVEWLATQQLRAMSLRYIEISGLTQRILDIHTGKELGSVSFLGQVSGPATTGGFPRIEVPTKKSREEFNAKRANGQAKAETFVPEVERVPAGTAFLNWDDHEGKWKRCAQRVITLPVSGGREFEYDIASMTFNRFPFIWDNRPVKPAPANALNQVNTRDPRIKPLLDHLMFLSGGDEAACDYFILYLAHLYQQPGDHIPWAPMFCTPERRMGKSMMFYLLADVFGGRASGLVSAGTGKQVHRMMERGFTEAIDKCWFKFVNELPPIRNPEVLDFLKSLISESCGESEHKGGGASDIQRAAQFIFTTNSRDVITDIANQGRFLVLGTDDKPRPPEYYNEFSAWAGSESHIGLGAQALADVLAAMQFPSTWRPKAPPLVTDYARGMNEDALPEGAEFVRYLVDAYKPPFDRDFGAANETAVTHVQNCARELGRGDAAWAKGLTKNRLGKLLAALGYDSLNKRASTNKNDNKPRCWRNAEQWNQLPTAALAKHLEDGLRPFEE